MLGVLLAAVLPVVGSTHVAAAATPPADAPPVSLVGDSTMAGMAWTASPADDPRAIVGNAYKLTFDAESCRRLIVASCRGRFGTVPLSVLPLMRSTLKGRLGEAMVVMAGYDDASITNAADQIVAEAEAQGVIRVLWLTYRTNTAYVLPGGIPARTLYGSHNSELAAAAQRHKDLQILDWDGFTTNQPTWFAADGVHLTLAGADGLANFIKTALDAQTAIGRCRATSALTGAPDSGVSTTSVPNLGPSGFVPLTPMRVLDTRDPALGGAAGKLGGGRTVSIDVSKIVPNDAVATAFSVTATSGCVAGYLTVFACGARPPTSNINYEVGRTTAGVAITPLTSGKVCIFSSAATDVVVDVMGAFTPGGDRFHPLTPTRWIDTRGVSSVQLTQVSGLRARADANAAGDARARRHSLRRDRRVVEPDDRRSDGGNRAHRIPRAVRHAAALLERQCPPATLDGRVGAGRHRQRRIGVRAHLLGQQPHRRRCRRMVRARHGRSRLPCHGAGTAARHAPQRRPTDHCRGPGARRRRRRAQRDRRRQHCVGVRQCSPMRVDADELTDQHDSRRRHGEPHGGQR